jgi:hypothetical protein
LAPPLSLSRPELTDWIDFYSSSELLPQKVSGMQLGDVDGGIEVVRLDDEECAEWLCLMAIGPFATSTLPSVP